MGCFPFASFAPFAFAASLAPITACIGSSGGEAFEFEASAAGPEDARDAGASLRFVTPRGYDVELTKATLHIGAVYMNELLPVSNARADSCLSPGRYTAEVTRGRDIDLLDGRLQRLGQGTATNTVSRSAEVWLTGNGDIDDETDATPILDVEGTASRNGVTYPFRGRVTIDASNKRPPPSPAQPGANPLCRERIVAPIPIGIVPERGGKLVVRVDPRQLFVAVELSELQKFSDDPLLYGFADTRDDAPSVALENALRAAPLYAIHWEAAP